MTGPGVSGEPGQTVLIPVEENGGDLDDVILPLPLEVGNIVRGKVLQNNHALRLDDVLVRTKNTDDGPALSHSY